MHTSQQTTSEGGGHTSHLPFCFLPPNLGPHLPGRSSSPSLSFGISESGPRSLKYSLSHICGHPGNSVLYVALDKINIGLKDKFYESPAWDTSNWLDSLQIPRATRYPQSCGYVPRLATSWTVPNYPKTLCTQSPSIISCAGPWPPSSLGSQNLRLQKRWKIQGWRC